jgi:hypothetical protein
MYLTIYTPGGESLSGDFRAQFDILSNAVPPAITSDTNVHIGGNPIVLHPSTYDAETKRYILPFTLQNSSLDSTALAFGLYLLLGITTESVKIVSIDYAVAVPDWVWLVLLLILLFILRKA